MIRKAKFENFKGLRDVEVTFESRFTVLVGPNGTGKTSVLQGVELVSRVAESELVQTFSTFMSVGARTVRIGIQAPDGHGFAIDLPANKPVALPGGQSVRIGYSHWHGEAFNRLQKIDEALLSQFGNCLRPEYRALAIATPTVTKGTPPPVAKNGAGIPALLGYLKLRDDELFARMEQAIYSILPNVKKIRIDEVSDGGGAAQKSLLFDTAYAPRVSAEQMSDGTLYILALIVAVLGPHRPKTLLIDDIDMRLHPKAQYELVTLLKKFLEEFPDLQIIATSHSPYILDRLDANEVLVTELADDGSVVIAPLTAHPTYPKWSESMTPGEFWSHTGEGWVKQLKKPGAATP